MARKKKNLTEGVSSVAYHATSISAANNILKTKAFKLAGTYGTRSEWEFSHDKKQTYFMSVTRSKLGSFHRKKDSGVMFVLNGDWFNRNYKSKPVDYFQQTLDPKVIKKKAEIMPPKAKGREFEDRIFSSTKAIKITPGMIQSVNILADDVPQHMRQNVYASLGKKVYMAAKKAGFETHLWNSPEDQPAWRKLDTSKESTPEKMGWTTASPSMQVPGWEGAYERETLYTIPFGAKPWKSHDWSYIADKVKTSGGDLPKHGKFSSIMMDRLYLWRELWHKKTWDSLSDYSKEALRDHFGRNKSPDMWLKRFQSDYTGQASKKTDFGIQGTKQMDKILKGKDPDIWAIEMYHKWKLIADQVGI